MEPLSAHIADLEELIEYLVRRNDVLDEEVQGIKTDVVSLTDKISTLKVSELLPVNSVYLYSTSEIFHDKCDQFFYLRQI